MRIYRSGQKSLGRVDVTGVTAAGDHVAIVTKSPSASTRLVVEIGWSEFKRVREAFLAAQRTTVKFHSKACDCLACDELRAEERDGLLHVADVLLTNPAGPPEDPTARNYVYVDVEDRDGLVRVYDNLGEIELVEFCSDRDRACGDYESRVTAAPYEAAVSFAKAQAAKLGCD